MFNIVKKKIGDKKLLNILYDIIFSVGGESNLPIGNLTSQWMGNVYLNELDHFVKEKLHARAYIRYCDDFLIFSDDKFKLHSFEIGLQQFLFAKLNLLFSKSRVFQTNNGVAFIGYRHFRKFILLRKYGARKIFKYIRNIFRYHDKSEHSVAQLAAFHGWIQWACSHNFKMNIYNIILQKQPSMARFVRKKFFINM